MNVMALRIPPEKYLALVPHGGMTAAKVRMHLITLVVPYPSFFNIHIRERRVCNFSFSVDLFRHSVVFFHVSVHLLPRPGLDSHNEV